MVFVVHEIAVYLKKQKIKNKHNPELQRTDPGTKVTGGPEMKFTYFLHDC